MAFPTPSTKKRILMQELKHYSSLLAQHEKNQDKGLNSLDKFSNSGLKASQKDFKFNSESSVNTFNYKSSYWKLKDNKHVYSKCFIKKMPARSVSKNMQPHTLIKQFNLKKDFSINNSIKTSRSKNYEKPSSKSYSKQSGNFSQIQNTIPKKCDYKTSKYLQESDQAKNDSKKLIGEIMAITHELKLKSKTLGSFQGEKYPPERDSTSKIKPLKVPTKEVLKTRKSLSQHSTWTNKNKVLSSSSKNFQVKAVLRTDCSKSLSCLNSGNRTLYANVQTKLNKIEKILENSSIKTDKKCSSSTGQKTNATSGVLFTNSKAANLEISNQLVKSLLRPKNENRKIKKPNSIFYAITNKNNLKPCQTSVFNCKSHNNSSVFFKKANQLTKTHNKLKSKYKVVNKALSAEKNITEKTAAAANYPKNFKLSNLRKKNLGSFKLNNVGIKKTGISSKMFLNHLSLKNSRHICVQSQGGNHVRQKHVYHYNIKKQNDFKTFLPKHLLQNKPAEIHNTSGVDTDLLLELAAENINLKQMSQRHIYKSKNRIINNHSIQKRTAKMIKMKYFNPNRKFSDWRNSPAKTFKGFFKGGIAGFNKQNKSFTKIHRSLRFNKNISNRLQTSKVHLQNKKIVTLKGEQFVIGSEGKSLKKLRQISRLKKRTKGSYNKLLSESLLSEKIASPASKIMANRVLSLSINRMLTASEKKKINKVNTYCMFYNRFGRCNKGVQCPYVHDPSKIAVCTRFLRGTCKNDKCPFSHEVNPGKMAICSFFLQDICTNIQCPYRHERLLSDAKLCKDFVQGYCVKGKECKNAHVLICPKYIQGICEKGKQCAFPHPAAKDKKMKCATNVNSKECISTEKIIDLSETVGRYFESSDKGNVVRGVVVPRRKTLPEQPSFISLTLEDPS